MNGTELINHFQRAVDDGRHWYIALLEAIGLWTEAEETCDGRVYRYLIAGEAFDWLLLAERIYESVDGLLPEEEKENLLFRGRAPIELSPSKFKKLIGNSKYRQYLNYFYGVTVEESLIQVVREEVRKERWSAGLRQEQDYLDEAYRRIYSGTQTELLHLFRKGKKYPQRKSSNLTELKEFTYWLFKYRLAVCDQAKVASDTKKALDWLKSRGYNILPTIG